MRDFTDIFLEGEVCGYDLNLSMILNHPTNLPTGCGDLHCVQFPSVSPAVTDSFTEHMQLVH